MTDDGTERRNFAREKTEIEAQVWSDTQHIRATVEYLSFGGAFISAPRTFLRDNQIRIEFDVPGEATPFHGTAKIVWVQKDKAMGVQFIDLPSSERLKLERILL